MDLQIKEIGSRDTWNAFVEKEAPHTFLESWEWGEFNKIEGSKIFRIGVWSGMELLAVALTIKIHAKRGSFLFVPHGPIIKVKSEKLKIENLLGPLIKYLKELARKEKCSFIRTSPIFLKNPENEKLFADLGFRKAPTHMHAELVWILDITKSEDELMRNMRKTTRYLINKAQKDGVEITTSENVKDVELFNEIYMSTVKRQRFTPFSLKYLENEFSAFVENKKALIFFAKYEAPAESRRSREAKENNGEIVSSAIIIFSNGGAFYHQGATSLKYPKIPAAYLLHWEVIKEAKRRGLSFYNFWGIAPENRPNHPWAGLSLFKKGFDGYSEEYLPAQDLIISWKYWLSWLIESVRKIKRGL